MKDDRSESAIGALSMIGQETVRSALSLARTGELFDLGLLQRTGGGVIGRGERRRRRKSAAPRSGASLVFASASH